MKMNLLMENWRNYVSSRTINDLQVLNETTLKRILGEYFKQGFIIVTADRSCEAEKGEKCSPEEIKEQEQINIENHKKLKSQIRDAGFGFVPAFGGYKEKVVDKDTGEISLVDTDKPENAFIVMARPEKGLTYEKLKEFGISMAKEYNQDSFLFKPANEDDKGAYYITKTGDVDMSFDDVTPNDIEQIYYTQLRKRRHERFTFTEDLVFEMKIPNPPNSTAEARLRRGEIFYRLDK